MQKNVASQKLVVFAFDSTTNLPKTGDAANLTAYVSKDYGSVTVLGDTSATEMDSTNAKGYYLFDLTQGETNGDTLLFSAKSSTANIVVVGAPAAVFTTPPNFSLESIDANGRLDVIKVAGTTQTARDLGASVLLSTGTGTGQLDFTSGVVKANATQWLGGTIPAANVTGVPLVDLKYTLGTISPATAGSVRADAVTGAVGSVTGAVGSVSGLTAATVHSDLDDIQARLPAALTGAGNMKSDALAIDGSTSAATHLSAHTLTAVPVTFDAGGSTTTAILINVDGAAASSTDDFYNGRVLIFTAPSGLKYQATDITDYVGATKTATITAVTTATGATTTAIMV